MSAPLERFQWSRNERHSGDWLWYLNLFSPFYVNHGGKVHVFPIIDIARDVRLQRIETLSRGLFTMFLSAGRGGGRKEEG